VVGLHRAGGDERVGAALQRLGDEKLELAGLVAAAGQTQLVVALEPDRGPAQVGAQPAQRHEPRGLGGVAASRELGQLHAGAPPRAGPRLDARWGPTATPKLARGVRSLMLGSPSMAIVSNGPTSEAELARLYEYVEGNYRRPSPTS